MIHAPDKHEQRYKRFIARMEQLMEKLAQKIPPEAKPEVDPTCLTMLYLGFSLNAWSIYLHVHDGSCWLEKFSADTEFQGRILGKISHEDVLFIAKTVEQEGYLRSEAVSELIGRGWRPECPMNKLIYVEDDSPCLTEATLYLDATRVTRTLCTGRKVYMPPRNLVREDFQGCAERFAEALLPLGRTLTWQNAASAMYAWLHAMLKPDMVWDPNAARVLLFEKEFSVPHDAFGVKVEVNLRWREDHLQELYCDVYSLDMRGGGGTRRTIAAEEDLYLKSPDELLRQYEEQITAFATRIITNFSLRDEVDIRGQDA